jgi:hypothetical protein
LLEGEDFLTLRLCQNSDPGNVLWEHAFGEVEVTSVDATDPPNTKVNYRLRPSGVTIGSATFTAPGKRETKTNLSGDFYFTYNQKNLSIGDNTIRLEATIGSTTLIIDCTAIRTEKKAPPTGTEQEMMFLRVPVEGVGLVLVGLTHSLFEQFHSITYSVPVVGGSKTIWVGESTVNIRSSIIEGVPTEIATLGGMPMWAERHMYRDNGGDHLEQMMSDVIGETVPAQGPHYRSKHSFNDDFFPPNNNLTGIGRFDSITFIFGGHLVETFCSIIPPANKEVDLPLE